MRFTFTVQGWSLGGFATFCRNLSAGLRGRGHEVALLVLPESNVRCEVGNGLFDQCVVVRRGVRRLGSHIERVALAIEQLGPESLVLNDTPYGMAALPLIGRSRVRIPVIHSTEPDEIELGLSQRHWWDRVAVVSESVERAVMARGMEPRLSLCSLGVPIAGVVRQPAVRDSRLPIEVISVGRVVVPQKRMDRIPAIARLLAAWGIQYHWTVLGDGEYLPGLRREINRAGLASRFTLAGRVGPAGVAEALQRSEVFVLPSDCEGMPQALLEAMAQGVIPVVSRIAGATARLVEQGTTGYLCEPAAAAEFARAVAELARNRSRCREMSDWVSRHAARQFSLDTFTDRFLQLVLEARAEVARRPEPLRGSARLTPRAPVRCLGFWRSLRHQYFGPLKRWVEAQTRAALAQRG